MDSVLSPLFCKLCAYVTKPLQEKSEKPSKMISCSKKNRELTIKNDLLLVSVFAVVENWERIKHPLQFGHHLLGLIMFLNEIYDTVFARTIHLYHAET